jgi:hypothetical protein
MMPLHLLVWLKHRNAQYRKAGFRWMGLVRATGYALVASAAVGTCSFRTAKADIAESSMALGRSLKPLADLFQENNALVLNGEAIQVSTANSSQNLDQVLDRFEQHCRENNGAATDLWKDLGGIPLDTNGTDHGALPPMPTPGIVRDNRGVEGTVMCLVRQPGKSFLTALTDFSKTRELSSFGNFRYAFVSQDKNGGTFVITAWTEGRFDLNRLVPPADGSDAPGSDSNDYPRPPGGRRMLTASVGNTPYGMRIYTSTKSPDGVAEFYDAEMGQRGWVGVKPPDGDQAIRFYVKDNIQLALAADKGKDGKTGVALAEMGRAKETVDKLPK